MLMKLPVPVIVFMVVVLWFVARVASWYALVLTRRVKARLRGEPRLPKAPQAGWVERADLRGLLRFSWPGSWGEEASLTSRGRSRGSPDRTDQAHEEDNGETPLV
jgi:hypothetical protein